MSLLTQTHILAKQNIKTFLVAKLLYKSKCPSVCQPRLGGNVIFSAPNWDIAQILVQIPFINELLFCKYFVRLSVGNATKGRKLCYLWMLSLFFLYICPIVDCINFTPLVFIPILIFVPLHFCGFPHKNSF